MPLTGKAIIYAADVTALSLPLSLDAVSLLRREKAEKLGSEADKRLSLGAELLLMHGLKEAGYDISPAGFSFNEHGKPYLKDGGLYFSISHSGDFAVCAVSDVEVGCDIEKVRSIDLKIARRFCAEEYNDISFAAPEAQLELFYRYWTLKESFMKATGRGFSLPMNRFQIIIGDEISVVQSLDERCFSFRGFDKISGYKCAVCMAGENCNAEFKIVDLNTEVGVE